MSYKARFFVMIRSQGGFPLLMVDAEEETQLFDTREEAEAAGKQNLLGGHYGYEVYEW